MLYIILLQLSFTISYHYFWCCQHNVSIISGLLHASLEDLKCYGVLVIDHATYPAVG